MGARDDGSVVESSSGARIGLEVHVQVLSLRTKLFCSCSSDYRGKQPNTNVCPVCMGLPGTLPVLNGRIVEEALKVALALHCRINRVSRFWRKNYFYPDLAKNYQISQYDRAGGVPFAQDCALRIRGGKSVRIRRVHVEEDPARIHYEGSMAQSPYALVDYNRHGIALLEIVTEPDMETPEEARDFLERLSGILEYLGIYRSDVEGAMRCDVNVSVGGGNRVEVKNVSGFSDVERAIRFELTRQGSRRTRRLAVERETRHWDEVRRITVSMRSKEAEEEYRYFPEPDLPPLIVRDEDVEKVRSGLPRLPEDRLREYVEVHGLNQTLAEPLAYSPYLSELFEECVSRGADPRGAAALITVDLLSYANAHGAEPQDVHPDPGLIVELSKLMGGGLSHKDAKDALNYALEKGVGLEEALRALGMRVTLGEDIRAGGPSAEGEGAIRRVVEDVLRRNPRAVEDARRNPRAVDYIVGMVLKELGRGTNAKLVARIVAETLDQDK
ncbi:Aspartyl-tRNA(Asn) amidotransferase subunit B [Conexivisphaera calida]|uniref:Aspartyl/glutamyl-tRNA(Asn/Gln) amidotransferase subunit B n=1 Tax=Conexivisphaera calida TaxID=1874277 RepID=A0A4P2VBG4_9ARCH|nr:Aspartyl-tRNA(Asn) amidotransferase subunit B [Conexivisphaera calida]